MARIDPKILEKFGHSGNGVDVDPDIYVRVPRNDESVFRAVVVSDGVPACGILQVWLDVAQHQARGKEQADLIGRRILAPLLLPKERHSEVRAHRSWAMRHPVECAKIKGILDLGSSTLAYIPTLPLPQEQLDQKDTVRFAARVLPSYEAVIWAEVEKRTKDVFTGNVALVAPAGMVTLEGTLAAPLLLASATCAPPAGAGPLSVTVPVEDCKPPMTLVGLSVSEERAGGGGGAGVTVSEAVLVTPP